MNFETLSEEMKAKAKACTSPEELLALAREEGYELSDEDLEGIAGGGWNTCYGDERDDVDESLVSEEFMTGALRGDGLD